MNWFFFKKHNLNYNTIQCSKQGLFRYKIQSNIRLNPGSCRDNVHAEVSSSCGKNELHILCFITSRRQRCTPSASSKLKGAVEAKSTASVLCCVPQEPNGHSLERHRTHTWHSVWNKSTPPLMQVRGWSCTGPGHGLTHTHTHTLLKECRRMQPGPPIEGTPDPTQSVGVESLQIIDSLLTVRVLCNAYVDWVTYFKDRTASSSVEIAVHKHFWHSLDFFFFFVNYWT